MPYDSNLQIDPNGVLSSPLFYYDNIDYRGWDDRYTYHPGDFVVSRQSDSLLKLTGDWYQYLSPPFSSTYYPGLGLPANYYVRNVYDVTGDFKGRTGDSLLTAPIQSFKQYAEWENRQTGDSGRILIYDEQLVRVFSLSDSDLSPPYTMTGSDFIIGSKGNDRIAGYGSNDWIEGGSGNDVLYGDGRAEFLSLTHENLARQITIAEDGNDVLKGGPGDDELYGGAGVDLALYSGNISNYTISKAENTHTLVDKTGVDGTDTLTDIERLKFSDSTLALDLDGNAGKVVKLLGAVFGKSSLMTKEFVGIGLSLLDAGTSYQDLAILAVSAAKKTSPTDICVLLWTNVVGTKPTDSDIAPFKTLLDSGQISIGALTTLAADTSFNIVNIDLVGLTKTGIEYV